MKSLKQKQLSREKFFEAVQNDSDINLTKKIIHTNSNFKSLRMYACKKNVYAELNGLTILVFDYKGRQKGQLGIKSLKSCYILELNSKYILVICTMLTGNDCYWFFSLKNYSLVFKSRQVEPIRGFLRYSQDSLLVGQINGLLTRFSLATFDLHSLGYNVEARHIYDLQRAQEEKDLVAIGTLWGLHFQKVDIYSDEEKDQKSSEVYFQMKKISQVLQYAPFKYCVSFFSATNKVVSLIDRTTQASKVVFHPSNNFCPANKMLLLRSLREAVLILADEFIVVDLRNLKAYTLPQLREQFEKMPKTLEIKKATLSGFKMYQLDKLKKKYFSVNLKQMITCISLRLP